MRLNAMNFRLLAGAFLLFSLAPGLRAADPQAADTHEADTHEEDTHAAVPHEDAGHGEGGALVAHPNRPSRKSPASAPRTTPWRWSSLLCPASRG